MEMKNFYLRFPFYPHILPHTITPKRYDYFYSFRISDEEIQSGISTSFRIENSNLALETDNAALKVSLFSEKLTQAWIVFPYTEGGCIIQSATTG